MDDCKQESCKFVQAQLRSLNSTYSRASKVTAALIKTRLDTEEILEQSLNSFVNSLSLQVAQSTFDLDQPQNQTQLSNTQDINGSISLFSNLKSSTALMFNPTLHDSNQNNRNNKSSSNLKYQSFILSKIQQIHFKRKWIHEQRQKYNVFIMNLSKQIFTMSQQLPSHKKQAILTSQKDQFISKPSLDLSQLQTLNHIIKSIKIVQSSTFEVFTLIFQQYKYDQSSLRFNNLMSVSQLNNQPRNNLFNQYPINNPQINNQINQTLHSSVLQKNQIITKFLGKLAISVQIEKEMQNQFQLNSQQHQQTQEQFQLQEFKCNGRSIHPVIQHTLNTCLRFSEKPKPKKTKEININKQFDVQNQYHMILDDILLSLELKSNKMTLTADDILRNYPNDQNTYANNKRNYLPHIFQFSKNRSACHNLLDCQQSLKQQYYKLVKLRLFSLENSSETSTTKRILNLGLNNKHKTNAHSSSLATPEDQQNNNSLTYFTSPEVSSSSSNNRKQLKQHKIDAYFKASSEIQHLPSLDNQFPAYIVKDYTIPQDNKQSLAEIQHNDECNSQLTFSDLPQNISFQELVLQNESSPTTKESVEVNKCMKNSGDIDLIKQTLNGQQYTQNNLGQLIRQQEIQNVNNKYSFSLKKQSTKQQKKQQALHTEQSIFNRLDAYKFNGDMLHHNNLYGKTIQIDTIDKFSRSNNNSSNCSRNIKSLVTAQNHQIHHLKERQSLFQKVKARTQASILRDSNSIQRDLFSRNSTDKLPYFHTKNCNEISNSNEVHNSSQFLQKSFDSCENNNTNSYMSSYSDYNNRATGYLTPSKREEDQKIKRVLPSENTREHNKLNKQGSYELLNQQKNIQKCYFQAQHDNILDKNESTTEHSRELNLVLSQFFTSKD